MWPRHDEFMLIASIGPPDIPWRICGSGRKPLVRRSRRTASPDSVAGHSRPDRTGPCRPPPCWASSKASPSRRVRTGSARPANSCPRRPGSCGHRALQIDARVHAVGVVRAEQLSVRCAHDQRGVALRSHPQPQEVEGRGEHQCLVRHRVTKPRHCGLKFCAGIRTARDAAEQCAGRGRIRSRADIPPGRSQGCG